MRLRQRGSVTITDPRAEEIAQVAHEANRAYCETLGDLTQVPWAAAPQWQKDSAINGVKLYAQNLGLSPERSHEAWRNEKISEGWTFGPVKSERDKIHPSLLPYDELPLEEQAKDSLFGSVCRALLSVDITLAEEQVLTSFGDIPEDPEERRLLRQLLDRAETP